MSKRSWDSLQRTRVWAASPWRRAFNDEIAFPSGVFGPLDMEPLRRADSSLRREDIFSLKLTGERAAGHKTRWPAPRSRKLSRSFTRGLNELREGGGGFFFRDGILGRGMEQRRSL